MGLELNNTLERRSYLLKLEGQGFNRREVTTALIEKFSVCKETVHRDYRGKSSWQPKILDLKDAKAFVMMTVNRANHIYREASFRCLQTQNEAVKVGFLRVMLEANKQMCETMILPSLIEDIEQIKQHLGLVTK